MLQTGGQFGYRGGLAHPGIAHQGDPVDFLRIERPGQNVKAVGLKTFMHLRIQIRLRRFLPGPNRLAGRLVSFPFGVPGGL